MTSNGTDTMPSTDRVLLVIGSGPGIGNATASLFATRRFQKVALIARSDKNLAESKRVVEEASKKADRSISVKTWAVDISDTSKLKSVLHEVESFGEVECVFFNAARVVTSDFFNHPESEIRYDLEITVLALYAVAAWAHPILKKIASEDSYALPTIMVTNSHLWNDPAPPIFALSLTKAAQHNMVRSLAMHCKDHGIHVCLLSPCGQVDPGNKNINPKNIAEEGWKLYGQKKEEWKLETRIED